MMLLEHDAKMLLAQDGVPVPHGFLASTAAPAAVSAAPCMVKAQVPIGGRGKERFRVDEQRRSRSSIRRSLNYSERR